MRDHRGAWHHPPGEGLASPLPFIRWPLFLPVIIRFLFNNKAGADMEEHHNGADTCARNSGPKNPPKQNKQKKY